MEIREVKSNFDRREFCDVCAGIYSGDSAYIRPLDIEIECTFDPDKNPFFSHGEACRWILSHRGATIGRVAAFINHEKAYAYDPPIGGMGFFECIDNTEAAFVLFDTCKRWLSVRGIKGMDGPVNFGENNNHWGLLVEGFTPPAFGMSYGRPYYRIFFEDYGFQPLYEQYTHHFDINKTLPDRFRKIVERVCANKSYRFEHLDPERISDFIGDFVEVYNKAWARHENFHTISYEYVEKSFEAMKPVMDPKMMWFAYVDNEPAGFIIAVPDANQIISRLNGKLNLFSKLKFLWHKHRNVMDRVRVIIMGVTPEHQKKGLESGLIVKSFDAVRAMNRYREAELSWVGSFNPAMIAIHKASGATFGKKHITYRKMF